MKNDEILNLIPCDEKGAMICQKIDEFHNKKDIVGCIQFLVKEINCDESEALHLYLVLTNQEEVDQDLTPQEIARNNQIAQDWQNKPKCITCGSTNIKKISTSVKVAGAVAFGLFSKTAKSQFECKNCGCKW